MNNIDALKFAATLRADILEIDIHGIVNVHDIEARIDTHMSQVMQYDSMCKIIHGIGSGIQKKRVHNFLKTHPMVSTYFLSEDGGSTIVIF